MGSLPESGVGTETFKVVGIGGEKYDNFEQLRSGAFPQERGPCCPGTSSFLTGWGAFFLHFEIMRASKMGEDA
jgi:hypothetical protein